MKILVTGGAGYIGGMVTQHLIEAGHEAVVLDNLAKGYRAAVPAGAAFVQADILDRAAMDATMAGAGFEAVFHFAALIEAGISMQEPGPFFLNNVAGSATLIEAAHQHGIPRFVFSSTAGVFASQDQPLTEEAPFGPSSVYGETKLMVERMLSWYARIHGMQVAVLRYFNAAGAVLGRGEAHQPESHLIPLVLQVALGQREHITVYGEDYPTPDGSCIRDYIHIADLASAHLLALQALSPQRPQVTYNLGSGQGCSVKQVIEAARRVTGHPIPAQVAPRRPGDAARLIADPGRIRAELGWQPQVPGIEDIIASAWQWHQHHPNGYPQ